MSTADTIAMAGVPAPVAKIIGEFIDAQQADDTELADRYGVAILPNGSMSISAASGVLWGA